MGSKHPFAVLLLLIVAIVASAAIFSDVYRWVDDDGVEHFGNKPPTQSDSTLVSTHDEMAPQSDDTSQTIEEIDRALISGNFEKAFQLLKPVWSKKSRGLQIIISQHSA